ncbi:MAG: hypothetical protein M3362_16695 [Acidobacteriota bacterium]|nr:hypothetical protein [Acidobacteriota bacterium]
MKLENPDELKKALAIIGREKPNLQLQRSKLMAMGLEDSTFRDSVKKATPNKETAEALVKELKADPKAVLKLNGAQALATKLEQTARADLATVQRTAERLKAVSEKFKKSGALKSQERFENLDTKLITVGYRTDNEASGTLNNYPTPPTQAEIAFAAFEIIVIVVLIAFTIIALVSMFSFLVAAYEASSGDKKAADCLDAAERKLETCDADASRLFPPYNIFASAGCWSRWLLDSAGCAWK